MMILAQHFCFNLTMSLTQRAKTQGKLCPGAQPLLEVEEAKRSCDCVGGAGEDALK